MEVKNIKSPANQLMYDRCSVRKYDTNSKISKEILSDIINDALTAPSSLNLQPWHFVVITSKESMDAIKPHLMFNKIQADTSSAFIVVYADLDSISNCDAIYGAASEEGLLGKKDIDVKLDRIKGYFANRSERDSWTTAVFDCGLVTMQLMLSAKAYGYDTNPIGGFERLEISKILGVDLSRYKPLLLLSIGKADEEYHESIRLSVDDVVEWK